MTARRPLVNINGQMQELPAGDTVVGISSTDGVYFEPVVCSAPNDDIVFRQGTQPVPSLVLDSTGDIVVARGGTYAA